MEITPFLWSFFWNLFLGFWITITIYSINIFKKTIVNKIDYLTSLTVWLLLWIIFIWFFPEIFTSNVDPKIIWLLVIIWLLFFFILELFMHWHHCKDLWHTCSKWHKNEHKNTNLMFIWTLIHNSFHWVILFSAFSINFTFWIATTITLLMHAIPLNISNYIMNHNNLKYSIIAAFWWVFWSIITYPFSSLILDYKFEILSIITWWLLYIALTDLFPNIKKNNELKYKIIYLLFIILWVIIFYIFNSLIS